MATEIAKRVGKYLLGCRLIDPRNTVILTSPLLRSVQTAVSVARGLADDDRAGVAAALKIYVEQSLVETAERMQSDIRRNKAIVGKDFPPRPLYGDAAFFNAHVSKIIQTEPLFVGPAPQYTADGDLKTLVESPPSVSRISSVADGLMNRVELLGKTVIVVGHREPLLWLYNALSSHPIDVGVQRIPPFCSVAELMPAPPHGQEKDCSKERRVCGLAWHPQAEPFVVPGEF
jgi:hypothetical protein